MSALNRNQQPAVSLFAVGMIGLGIVALIYRDFALVWQPVPEWVPGRAALAVASGVLMLLCGAGLLFRATAAWAVRILLPYLVLWALLKVPALFAAPGMEGVYLGLGELTMLLSGGWILFARLADMDGRLGFLTGERGVRAAEILFGISVIPVGLSHLVYGKITADYVPAWLPFRIGWAYLTGAGQIASGLGIVFKVLPRVAATAEAIQITLYTFLIWAVAVVAKPTDRLSWTAFFISWAIGAAAWVVAQETLAGHAARSAGPIAVMPVIEPRRELKRG
jgi:uncharacterized membrane protein